MEGFQVDNDCAIVAVQFLPDGHEGEQVLVVGDIGHDVPSDDAGPFPAWGPHLVGGDAEDGGRGVNEVVDECWGHGVEIRLNKSLQIASSLSPRVINVLS